MCGRQTKHEMVVSDELTQTREERVLPTEVSRVLWCCLEKRGG